ncbi:30S ribosomal protein THX [Sphingobacterium paludis]|uniref:Ribosomal small subunit protein bTHX n=1 Tax=Sphingobacterium paludis TaxID=1476465 RepID=A0A4R7DBM3_9SPHI|nr:30S ribosomal protein THX [Sphingobacterium paludis]TDS17565.1 ribosomal small subunit protein bTHX [Sphingobacterium paludis]
MGKGDKKTRKGKIIMGSFGKKRPKNGPRVTPKKQKEEA